MRTRSKVLLTIGVALAVLAGLWALIAPGLLVKYPNHVDKTAVATGTFSLAVNPSTGAPLAKPEVLPLTIRRHVHVVSSSGSHVVVKEDALEKIGPLPQQDVQQQYVLDRSSVKNLPSQQSYAYAPTQIVNRAPAYSINFPFHTGAGPYQVWKNEVGRSYTFRQQGAKVNRDGLTLVPFVGQLTDVPAQPYYLAQLSALGHLPTHTTVAQLTPQLKALGIDPARLSTVLLQLSTQDRAAVTSALARPIPLRYVDSVKTRLLVEPTTGAVVSLDRINEALGVQAQLGGLNVVGAVLGKTAYRTNPAIIAARDTLAKLPQRPPTSPVFSYTYGQTPASVADIASYAKSGAQMITAAETTIPLAVLLLGVLSATVGLGLWRRDRRREGLGTRRVASARKPAAPGATPTPPVTSATAPANGIDDGRPAAIAPTREPETVGR